ncbi:proline iminopeptidase, putative [Talaromyces stipitatus ATCC 10500]|uniref:Proline iminopeptidase, putative n=1 Tax=Talaromyces stipitatus (strain ATCC 10500 / CBS 375.48 / QM 6759 / NRRL 1006) TaxID=441959 RepID=B8MHQ9_TALSN|nr:proline iminopeptidase, putative [Talaromyces stipitatus ATCC 10500]EED16389.1 proline iminopeptidase, putative [Talaromyces stipitatus ATCC 10500]
MDPIPPAQLLSKSEAHVRAVPLDYSKPESRTIRLFARTATRYSNPIVPSTAAKKVQPPFLVFFTGGPGAGNPAPQESPITSFMIDYGYDIVYLDYRGTGNSSPISAETLELIGGPTEQAQYPRLFRADALVKDCEVVRQCLTDNYPPELKKWTIFGQSFGGAVSLNYFSFYPEGVRECFITAGLGSLRTQPEELYARMYKRVIKRNKDYYAKYPADVGLVKDVASHIRKLGGQEGILLPTAGRLTVQRLMTLRLHFGGDGGFDRIHDLFTKLKADLDIYGFFTRPSLHAFEQSMTWDIVPIYAMHDSWMVNGPGIASNWTADRVGKTLGTFPWLAEDWQQSSDNEPLYFSGGMLYPFLFDTYAGLVKIKEAAQLIAKFDDWPYLYDEKQLAKNEFPYTLLALMICL